MLWVGWVCLARRDSRHSPVLGQTPPPIPYSEPTRSPGMAYWNWYQRYWLTETIVLRWILRPVPGQSYHCAPDDFICPWLTNWWDRIEFSTSRGHKVSGLRKELNYSMNVDGFKYSIEVQDLSSCQHCHYYQQPIRPRCTTHKCRSAEV